MVKVGIPQTFKTHHVIMVVTSPVVPLVVWWVKSSRWGLTWPKAEMEFRKQAGENDGLFLTFFEERTWTSVIYTPEI